MNEGSKDNYNKQKNTIHNQPENPFTFGDDSAWSPEKIKFALTQKGFTLASLARHHGLSDSTFRMCLRKRWYEAEVLLAEALSTPEHPITPQQIWPDRYDAHGYPLKYTSHIGNTNARKKKPK